MNRTKANHLYAILVVLVMLFGILGMVFPQAMTANAASVDYPTQLLRISTYDNSRNLNISGYTDKSALNTWTTNGVQNENWRFDYVGESSYGKYYKITNMGTGKLITPLGYETASGRYSYEWIILNKYIKPAQTAGAVPVLVTPITRRGSDGTPNYAAHMAYQQGLIQLGKDYNVPVIDATALTTAYYNEIGADNTAVLHCWVDAEHTTLDNTHLSEQGATVVAGIIAAQTKVLGLTIGNFTK